MTKDNKIEFLFKTPLDHYDLDVALDIPAWGVTALFGPSGQKDQIAPLRPMREYLTPHRDHNDQAAF